LGKNRLSRRDDFKEIRFWGKIGLGAALILKKSDFGEKSDWERWNKNRVKNKPQN